VPNLSEYSSLRIPKVWGLHCKSAFHLAVLRVTLTSCNLLYSDPARSERRSQVHWFLGLCPSTISWRRYKTSLPGNHGNTTKRYVMTSVVTMMQYDIITDVPASGTYFMTYEALLLALTPEGKSWVYYLPTIDTYTVLHVYKHTHAHAHICTRTHTAQRLLSWNILLAAQVFFPLHCATSCNSHCTHIWPLLLILTYHIPMLYSLFFIINY